MNKNLISVVAGAAIFISSAFSTNPFSIAQEINSCKQANYPDMVVQNGHTVGSANDLFTRHMICDEDNSLNQTIVIKSDNNKKTNKVIPTQKPNIPPVVSTPKPQLPPVPNPTKNPPAKVCHNKNDAKDNNHSDCNAGKGNDNK